jgi:transcriptional regulator
MFLKKYSSFPVQFGPVSTAEDRFTQLSRLESPPMYIPPAFAESDPKKLHEFIERHSFGLLVSHGAEPLANHLPFLVDPQAGAHGRLIGHMARANPQWQQASGNSVLVVFSGPHAYISPSWYDDEYVVPTWNYAAVHVYGTFRLIDDHAALMRIVQDTVDRYEQEMPQPWMINGSNEFLDRLMQMIVGFHIEIDRIEGKWKLSQNQSRERRERVVRALLDSANSGAHDVARLMREGLDPTCWPEIVGCRDNPFGGE